MNRRKTWIKIVSFLVIAAIIAGYVYWNNLGMQAAAVPAYTPVPLNTPGVKAATASLSVKTNPLLPKMEAMMENDFLQFFINKETAEFAVVDKRNGSVWFSNPQDRDQDTLAAGANKGKLGAQLSLLYLTKEGHSKEYDSYNDSVQYQMFDVKQNDQGVLVTYHFGNPEKGLEVIPQKISKARLQEKVLSKLDEEEGKQVTTRFKLNPTTNIYDRRAIPSKAVEKQLLKLFEKAGYTEAELAVDNSENGQGTAESVNPKFTAALQYALDGDQLVASVDTTALEESQPYRIQTIGMLENFGAGGLNDDGYLFIPDGSGALIRFNNGKGGSKDGKTAQPINIGMYGDDGAIYKHYQYAKYDPSRLPVFGIKKKDSALFAVIEEGDALARITADVSGRLNQYNQVSSNFLILPSDEVSLGSGEIMIKMPKKRYMGKLQLRYSFLYGDKANYSGMASAYRDYLVKRYGLKKISAEGDTPFYLELAGDMPKQKSFIGFQYRTMVALSPFDQTKQLIEQLNANSIRNIQLNYKGWFNSGVNHEIARNVKLDRALGSAAEWRGLADQLQKSSGQLYPDVAFLHVYGKEILNSTATSGKFNPSKDAVLHISRKINAVYTFDPSTYWKDWWRFSHYVLSPSVLPTVVFDFLDGYKKYNPGAISLRDLGDEVDSDFRNSREVTREDAKHIISQQAELIRRQAPKVMVSGGNEYLIPFADHILNAPEASNTFQLTDESVPFYQMVLHGYVEYAGKPFNMEDDQNVRKNMLRSLETGSNVFYSWVLQHTNDLKLSDYFDTYYSNDAQHWIKDAVQAYSEVNGVLKQVKGQTIVSHQKLAEGVYKTTFENGKSIIVNYGLANANVDGMAIEAGNYKVVG